MDKTSPHTLQIKEGKKVYDEENKDTLIPRYLFPNNCITKVYGNRSGLLEYSQTRSTGPEILSIICRF
ncbi:MAG: hypothetical protein ABJB76_01390 [Candidatus Nitrosocosmicus sp.]